MYVDTCLSVSIEFFYDAFVIIMDWLWKNSKGTHGRCEQQFVCRHEMSWGDRDRESEREKKTYRKRSHRDTMEKQTELVISTRTHTRTRDNLYSIEYRDYAFFNCHA